MVDLQGSGPDLCSWLDGSRRYVPRASGYRVDVELTEAREDSLRCEWWFGKRTTRSGCPGSGDPMQGRRDAVA